MTVLLTGSRGQLGRALLPKLAKTQELLTPARGELDLRDPELTHWYVAEHRPNLIINCAAYTDVDGAQSDAKTCYQVNAHAPAIMAAAAPSAQFIQISTDYVFAGDATAPYTTDSPTDGCGVYGQSKELAEQKLLATASDRTTIVRTAWLYSRTGRNFLTTMLDLASRTPVLSVVDDQVGQPTWAEHVAARLHECIAVPPGIYHCTNSGQTTWFEFACAIFALAGLDVQVRPISSGELAREAPRPAYSVLDDSRWFDVGLPPLPDWREALSSCLSEGST